jgi:hypothetical protein
VLSRKLVEPCWEGEEVILDGDATEVEAERQDAQRTYHHVQGCMPLVGCVDGVCMGREFREGNQSPGAGILAFAQRCEAGLSAGKRTHFRSDSAAYPAEVINHYSQPGRSFSIAADLRGAVSCCSSTPARSSRRFHPHRKALHCSIAILGTTSPLDPEADFR